MICLAVILIMYLAGIFAAWVTPHDYRAVDTQYPKRPLPWVDAKLATKTVVERVKNRTTEVSVDGARKLKQGTGINQAPELNRDLAVGDRVQIVSRVAGSWSHPFGTDRAGRDLLTRVIYGLRTTVIITILAIVTGGLFLGIGLGLLSGYFEKWVDSLIMRVGEIFLAFPDILLVLLIAATLRPRVVDWVRDIGGNDLVRLGIPDYLVVFGALAAFSWVGMARLVRGQVLYVKQAQFVEAAQAAGASTRRILGIHVLPNVISPVIVLVSMGMGQAAGAEIILSWLGDRDSATHAQPGRHDLRERQHRGPAVRPPPAPLPSRGHHRPHLRLQPAGGRPQRRL